MYSNGIGRNGAPTAVANSAGALLNPPRPSAAGMRTSPTPGARRSIDKRPRRRRSPIK